VVEGERHVHDDRPDARYHLSEIRRGPFRIEVLLPASVDADGVDATYERGLLAITLPWAGGA
jgi:HSP20 family protein